jgi:hypothetical protein
MTWTVIGHSIGSGNTGNTPALNTTGADLLIVCVSTLAGNPPTISDNKSNTYTLAVSNTGTVSRSNGAVYYCHSPAVGAGHVATNTASNGGVGVIELIVVSGSAAVPLDVTHSASKVGPATTEAPGSVTPTQSGELCIAFYSIDDDIGSTFSIDSGFTILDHIDVTPGAQFGGVAAYFIQSTAAAINPTLTRSVAIGGGGGKEDTAEIATFKGVVVAETPLKRRVRNLYFR